MLLLWFVLQSGGRVSKILKTFLLTFLGLVSYNFLYLNIWFFIYILWCT